MLMREARPSTRILACFEIGQVDITTAGAGKANTKVLHKRSVTDTPSSAVVTIRDRIPVYFVLAPPEGSSKSTTTGRWSDPTLLPINLFTTRNPCDTRQWSIGIRSGNTAAGQVAWIPLPLELSVSPVSLNKRWK